jgi:probable HAF family extracellular repeat protein
MPGDAAQHAFLYTGTPGGGGSMADLGTLGGSTSGALSINTHGHVVGLSDTTGGAAQHAFLYTGTPGHGGAMIDLDAWLDATDPLEGAKWTLTTAYGVSDNGLVTGSGRYDDGPGGMTDGFRAFRLDAGALVPEPGSLFVLSFAGMAGLWRRCRRPKEHAGPLPTAKVRSHLAVESSAAYGYAVRATHQTCPVVAGARELIVRSRR